MKKNILITGAYGFIGRYVAKECKLQNYYVIGIGHGRWSSYEYKEWGIDEWYECDITIKNLEKYITTDIYAIIHCAGGSTVRFSIENPMLDFEKSVWSSHYILEYIRKYSINTKLVYVSSAAVYGLSNKLPLKENEILNPISPYGYHKKIVEELCKMYANQYGINIIIGRLFSVYGSELKKQLLWDACKKIKDKNMQFFGTGEETRDWIHVIDVAKYLVYAINKADDLCDIVNIASGKNISVKKVLDLLFEYYATKQKPIFNGIVDKGNPKDYLADVSKIKTWHIKQRFSLEQGIKDYVRWYKIYEKD